MPHWAWHEGAGSLPNLPAKRFGPEISSVRRNRPGQKGHEPRNWPWCLMGSRLVFPRRRQSG